MKRVEYEDIDWAVETYRHRIWLWLSSFIEEGGVARYAVENLQWV
jgi:hypothetical protein